MNLVAQIDEALKQAMKAQDEVRKRSIRAIKAQVLLLKTDGTGEEITDEKVISVLQKMLKQREESLAIYEQQQREELAKVEREEIEVIKTFLPQPLSETELEAEIKAIIAETGVSSAKDMGKVIGAANKKLAGKADGKSIAAMTKKLLS